MTELEVRLTADIENLKRELETARKLLAEYGKDSEREGKRVKKGFDAAGKGAKNVTPTILEFNRVIQDAPFGIQGVANNITQLTQNFGDLRNSTGSTSGALKALVSGFTGPAGILFAVSAVTSLLVVYGDKLKLTSGFTDELAKATAGFVASAKTEIEVLNNLVRIASDENQSKKVRLGAINDINEKYSKYLGNLDEESIKTDAVKASIDALTKSLLKQAQVRGIQALIEEKYKDSTEELVKLQLEQKNAAKAVEAEVNNLRSSVAAFNNVSKNLPLTDQIKQIQAIVNRSGGSGSGRLRVLSNLLGQFNQAVAATREFTNEFNKELDPLREILSDATISDLFQEFFDIDEITLKGPKQSIQKFRNEFLNLDDIFGIETAAQNSLNKLKPIFENFKVELNAFGDIIGFELKNSVSKAVPGLSNMEATLAEYGERYNQIINTGYANAFAGIGQAIGEALITGENLGSALGKSLLSTMGSVVSQLGELAIQTGIGLLAVKKAFESLNPYVAIAAGVALVALGSAFSSSTRSIGNSFGGGGGSGSISGQSQQGGRISNGTGSFGASVNNSGTVVFEISGQKLVGVLNRTLGENGRLGGNISLG